VLCFVGIAILAGLLAILFFVLISITGIGSNVMMSSFSIPLCCSLVSCSSTTNSSSVTLEEEEVIIFSYVVVSTTVLLTGTILTVCTDASEIIKYCNSVDVTLCFLLPLISINNYSIKVALKNIIYDHQHE